MHIRCLLSSPKVNLRQRAKVESASANPVNCFQAQRFGGLFVQLYETMFSKCLWVLLTCFAGAQARTGADKVVERELVHKPEPTSSQYFNIINLFSYDQPLALQANAVPGGAQNAQDSFIQFYLNDQGNGRNGGAQLTWDPQENQGPPINKTQKLEFDGFKTATLRSYQPPGDFVVDIRHE